MFPCTTCVVAFTSQAYLDKHKKYCRGIKPDQQGAAMMATTADAPTVTVLSNVNPLMTQSLAPEINRRPMEGSTRKSY